MKINPALIPEHIAEFEYCKLEIAIVEYFNDPVHEREFKRWRKERRKHEKADFAKQWEAS